MIHTKKWMVVPYESEDEDQISNILINPKMNDWEKISTYNNELLKNKNKVLQTQTEEKKGDSIKLENEENLIDIKKEPFVKKEMNEVIKNDLRKDLILDQKRKKNAELKKNYLNKKNNEALNTTRTPMKNRLRGQKRELNKTHIQNHSMLITDESDDFNNLTTKRQYETINREKKILKREKNDKEIDDDDKDEDNFDPLYNQLMPLRWSFNDKNIPSINIIEKKNNDESLMDAN